LIFDLLSSTHACYMLLLHVIHGITLSFQLPFLVKQADTQHMIHVLISDHTFGTSDMKKILHYEQG